ncbi:peroxiredoxin [Psychrobacter sp. FDAARGOS_221]|uniref:peroxiredoxin n=1 Tax=Psychrobacter sp. FDAARGOS_221 TaxID=1975705 RepID=UPI000BB59752|nr:peroxiredoxin [Psychrobacter sp. FDAARGOS_221]PNK59754.1 peroxiredoxin [Psychrobacter sp. FDAARGOS_221]
MAHLRLGDTAPNFDATTTDGDINFHDWAGDNWVVFFSHPADFTPVCTTELGRTAALNGEFQKRGVKPIAISVDDIDDHNAWAKDIGETQGTDLNFPIVADPDKKVAELYDMIHPNAATTHTVRSVFIIDPAKKVRLTLTYPASVGRNFDEILRVIDALQLTDEYNVATPVDWTKGKDVIIPPSIKTEDISEKDYPKGFTEIKPYLRTTPDPSK